MEKAAAEAGAPFQLVVSGRGAQLQHVRPQLPQDDERDACGEPWTFWKHHPVVPEDGQGEVGLVVGGYIAALLLALWFVCSTKPIQPPAPRQAVWWLSETRSSLSCLILMPLHRARAFLLV